MIPPPAPLGTDAAGDRVGPGPAAGARPETVAERRFRFELAAHPGAVAQARRVTRDQLTGWSLCEDTCDTAALVVSELVTNAIVHTASTQIVCELHDGDDLVRIAVRDEGCAPGEPHPSSQRPEEEHGRGLLLIESLCRSWGAQPVGLGLLVWADVPRGLLAGAVRAAEVRADVPTSVSTSVSTSASTAVSASVGVNVPAHVPKGAGRGTDTGARSSDRTARSDLGWGAKKPPTEDRDGEAEAFRLKGAEGRLNGAEAGHRTGFECRTEFGVRPKVGRRTGAEWV
ncbi:ATP-binding protein [Streptomyces phaeolivaceus]|uniref:ATP-binding protein n=1 Tax=Streptomyces phaeolivaceus TaxID=2653200 RepID=UPI001D03B1EE|nr:ATP-binding protein [Streptomyces phaeolivaceus]